VYSYLVGLLAEKFPMFVTVDVGGVGYCVTVPLSTSQQLPELGERVKLLVHHVVREDAQLLFGFCSEEERSMFRLLISVSGIGPKLALAALSGLGVSELRRAIVDGQVVTLASISGIGRKTAERIVVELREKMVMAGFTKDARTEAKRDKNEALLEDSLQALVSLGYTKQTARSAIQKALTSAGETRLSSETLIRESLKYV